MNDELNPDPFEEQLGPRLRAVAEPIDGDGVSRAGVAAAVDRRRRRQARSRTFALGAAAVIALLGGLAVATRSGGDGPEQVTSGGPTTTVDPCDAAPTPESDLPAFWFRLSDAQAEFLLQTGSITEQQAEAHDHRAVRLYYPELPTDVGGAPIEPIGVQLFQMGSIDPAVLGFLRDQGELTAAQETTIADGVMPAITQEQADRILAEFPTLEAFPAGGGPLRYLGASPEDPDDGSGSVITTTTFAGAEGGTPFDEWVAVLEAKGLLTDEQRAEAAADRGFSLTEEQSAALQEYWDQQAADATTSAPSFAPGTGASTTEPGPCTPTTTAVPTSTSAPKATTTTEPVATTATAPVTSATTAVAPEGGTWVVYLYVLNGRENDDGSITPAIDVMQELMAGDNAAEEALAQEARDAARGEAVFEGALRCDVGAAEQLGLDPKLGQLGISVGFADEADANAFARSFDDASSSLEPMGPILVAQTCAARPTPS